MNKYQALFNHLVGEPMPWNQEMPRIKPLAEQVADQTNSLDLAYLKIQDLEGQLHKAQECIRLKRDEYRVMAATVEDRDKIIRAQLQEKNEIVQAQELLRIQNLQVQRNVLLTRQIQALEDFRETIAREFDQADPHWIYAPESFTMVRIAAKIRAVPLPGKYTVISREYLVPPGYINLGPSEAWTKSG